MTATLDSFASETMLTDVEQTLTSTNSVEKKFLGMATVTNTSTAPVEITVWRIATGSIGTEGVGGNWSIVKIVAAKQTERLDKILGQVLGNGMKVSALASVAGVVNIDLSGTTETPDE